MAIITWACMDCDISPKPLTVESKADATVLVGIWYVATRLECSGHDRWFSHTFLALALSGAAPRSP